MSILNQALGTTIVCYGCLTLGIMYNWPSSTIKLFSSSNTTLHRPMTETELALLGSLPSVSALICTPLCGFLLDTLGRKKTCILFSLPQVVAWAIVCAIPRVEAILLAVAVSGISGCVLLTTPVYVGEFCQESIRGTMTSGSIVFYGVGALVSYLLGGLLAYHTMNYICLALAVAGTAMITLIPDSPTYLMKKGQERDAVKAVAYYRAAKIDSKVVLEEINTIRRILNPEFDDETPEQEKLQVDCKPKEKLSFWKFMKKSRSSRQAFVLTLFLYTAVAFQGLVPIQVYAEPIFQEAVPNMSTTVTTVIFAAVTVVASFSAAYFVDSAGRRPLIMYASIATGICCVILGSQIQLHWGPHWLTALFLCLYTISYTFGAGTVPYVMIAEVFLPEVRSIASMLAIEYAWVCNFIILFVFNPMVNYMGVGAVFYFFAIVCFLTAVYSYFFVPETTGLTIEVIQKLFKNPRKTILL